MKIQITQDILDKCEIFAKKCVSTNIDKYASRGQYNKSKIEQDIIIGKIGEEAAYKFLSEKFSDLSQIDYNIYEKGKKSWDSDLKSKSLTFSCKASGINAQILYGESYIFQHGDGFKDCDKEVFDNKNDNAYAVFVSVNIPKKIAEVRAIIKISWLHEKNLFKPMVKENLRNNKKAVYYDGLLNFKDELWQL